ncbi:MAG: IS4 family transposase [Erysipelotrichaceae bacterium]|nr:IS4 family transposase [Erysipelotrichaceae bacterium]
MSSKSFEQCSKKLAGFFRRFGEYIRSEEVRSLIRKFPTAFVRIYKFPWFDVIYYLIFRNENCTPSEISSYYADIGKKHLRISRQAAFKAIKKVRWQVFPALIRKFAELFYSSDIVKTYHGYILLAEDGTCNELMPTENSLNLFGFARNQNIKCREDALKSTSRSAALYDVTNGLIVNFSMNPFKSAEIPIAVNHLEESHDLFSGRKVIYLADRNYGSVELFSILEGHGFNYCIRAKSNFFKKEVADMSSDDEWITVHIDKIWQKRLKYAQPKDRFLKDPFIQIRVVKHLYSYFDKYGSLQTAQLMYFTNLSEDEFCKSDIVSLYSKRWDLEVSYKTLKTDLEWERFFSRNCDCELCAIYSKVLFHNLNGIVRKELNEVFAEDPANKDNKYIYSANITQLAKSLREFSVCRYIRSRNYKALRTVFDLIFELRHKLKVPIRPDRHNQRWGRVVVSSAPIRFRLDGRHWPKVVRIKGHLQTTQP